jgi:hypothetical protein
MPTQGHLERYPKSRQPRRRDIGPRECSLGEVISSTKRPAPPVWMGPMKAAVGGIGCRLIGDGAAKIWRDGQARPRCGAVQATCYTFERRGSLVMQGVIEERLKQRIWKELSEEEAGNRLFVSREFIAYNADSKPLSVADLSHLSDHYDRIVTKSETLEGFSASLLPDDNLLSMDLRSGFNHFRVHKDMRKYFTVRVKLRHRRHRVFQYLVLPFGWSRSGYWFSRLVQRFWTMVKRRYGYRV